MRYDHDEARQAGVRELIGLTLLSAENRDDEELVFTTVGGRVFKLVHEQDCCESVYIESIVGDLADLVGAPILAAEESTSEDPPGGFRARGEAGYELDSETWTFYKFATVKGWVDVRWYGTSNGYYSERVDFIEV